MCFCMLVSYFARWQKNLHAAFWGTNMRAGEQVAECFTSRFCVLSSHSVIFLCAPLPHRLSVCLLVCLSTCLSICLSRCHASFFLEACHLNVEKGWHSGRWPPLSNPAASQPLRHDSSSSSLPFPHLEPLLVSFTREIPNSQHHPPKGTE